MGISSHHPATPAAIVPPPLQRVGDALDRGDGSVRLCREAGADLASRGLGLEEAIDALRGVALERTGSEPSLAEVRALASSWAEESLGYLHRLTCSDPLTGLATQAHLLARLHDLARARSLEEHVLVVLPLARDAGPPGLPGTRLDTAVVAGRLGDQLRAVFAAAENPAQLGERHVVQLAEAARATAARLDLLRRLVVGHGADEVLVHPLPAHDLDAVRLVLGLAEGRDLGVG